MPEEFESDGASVPRCPLIYDAWGDKAHREAFGHDFGYRSNSEMMIVNPEANDCFEGPIPEEYILDRIPILKSNADWYFMLTMRDRLDMNSLTGVVRHTYSCLSYGPMWLGVKWFGKSSYHRMKVMDHFEVVQ